MPAVFVSALTAAAGAAEASAAGAFAAPAPDHSAKSSVGQCHCDCRLCDSCDVTCMATVYYSRHAAMSPSKAC